MGRLWVTVFWTGLAAAKTDGPDGGVYDRQFTAFPRHQPLNPNIRAMKMTAATTRSRWMSPPPIRNENPPNQAMTSITRTISIVLMLPRYHETHGTTVGNSRADPRKATGYFRYSARTRKSS
jgi:hypothetical protein